MDWITIIRTQASWPEALGLAGTFLLVLCTPLIAAVLP